MHCCAGNLFHLQWPIHMTAWPIEIFLKGPWAHSEKNLQDHWNNTESLIICHCAFSFIVIVCCNKSKVFSCRVLSSVIVKHKNTYYMQHKYISFVCLQSLKVLCDVKSPQTTATTGNIRAGRGYFANRKKNYSSSGAFQVAPASQCMQSSYRASQDVS